MYSQLLSAMVQQQVSGLTEQLPEMLRPEGAPTAEEAGSPLDSTNVLLSLIENLINSPLWLILAVVGVVLVYIGPYITQRQRLGWPSLHQKPRLPKTYKGCTKITSSCLRALSGGIFGPG